MALSACVSARGSLSGESGKSCERHRSHCSDCALTESYFSHYALTTVPSPSPVSGVNFSALHERARPTDAQGVCVCVCGFEDTWPRITTLQMSSPEPWSG